jgi:hypothetical protein
MPSLRHTAWPLSRRPRCSLVLHCECGHIADTGDSQLMKLAANLFDFAGTAGERATDLLIHRCTRFSSSPRRARPAGVSAARLAAPTNRWSPAHYFGRPRKLGPALNLLGGHARGGARLRSLYVLAEAGPRRGPALELAKIPSENNMIWRLRRPLAAYNVVAAV